MSYVFIDLETTGLDHTTCHITEVAAVKTNVYGDVIAEMNFLVKLPEGEKVPPKITEITGITDEMLEENGSDIHYVIDILHKFIGDSIVVAQYAPFDLSYIEKHFLVRNFYDTRTLAYELKLPNAKLNGIAEHYGIELEEHHRALSDAHTCKSIFFEMVEDLMEKGVPAGQFLNVVGTKPERMPDKFPTNTLAVVDYGKKEEE